MLVVERGSQPCLMAFANLSDKSQELPFSEIEEQIVLLTTESHRYGGQRHSEHVAQILPYELIIFGPKEWQI